MLQLMTGSRLHFGLVELAANQPHRYGGLGMMIDAPSLELRLTPSGHQLEPTRQTGTLAASADNASAANSFSVNAIADDELQRRIQSARQLTSTILAGDYANCRPQACQFAVSNDAQPTIELVQCPPMHSGLGVGTQLAAAVACLLERDFCLQYNDQPLPGFRSHQFQQRAHQAVARLAHLSGRGKRSAIGLHGFLFGGLVKDLGYVQPAELNADGPRPIATSSTAVPSSWRIVLATSVCTGDMCGVQEDSLIARASQTPNLERERMLQLADLCSQAATHSDFNSFTQALDQYMELAARLFAPVQAGRYRDALTAQRVENLRRAGLAAVGQSSWGPTVFGFAPSQDAATTAADHLASIQFDPSLDHQSVRILIAAPLNHGVRWLCRTSEAVQHAS